MTQWLMRFAQAVGSGLMGSATGCRLEPGSGRPLEPLGWELSSGISLSLSRLGRAFKEIENSKEMLAM